MVFTPTGESCVLEITEDETVRSFKRTLCARFCPRGEEVPLTVCREGVGGVVLHDDETMAGCGVAGGDELHAAPALMFKADLGVATPGVVRFAIFGRVYDVPEEWASDEHPGGEDLIEEARGADVGQEFMDIAHSKTARKMLEEFYIGDYAGGVPEHFVKEGDHPADPAFDAFS